MPRTPNLTFAVGALALALSAITPASAAPSGSIAVENVSGTQISLAPAVSFEKATLILEGPQELRLEKDFGTGEPISLILLDGEARPLPDGVYRYGLRISPRPENGRSLQRGLFYIENGRAVSRESKRSELTRFRRELNAVRQQPLERPGSPGVAGAFSDFVIIFDDDRDGSTALYLQSDPAGGTERNWYLLNDQGLLRFDHGGGYPTGSNPAFSINHNANHIGIGTDYALGNLMISDTNFPEIYFYDPGTYNGVELEMSPFGGLSFKQNLATSLLLDAEGRLGVGTTAPANLLHVFNGTLRVERDDGIAPNIRFRSSAPALTQNWLFQLNANTGVFAIRDETAGNSPLRLERGAPDNSMTIFSDGRVAFNRGSASHPIHVGSTSSNGNGARLTGGGVWTNASSRSSKEDIEELSAEEALTALVELDPVKFKYRDVEERHVGFIAEDVPELVATTDRTGLAAMDIVAVLTEVVQHQQRVIETLSARLEKLEAVSSVPQGRESAEAPAGSDSSGVKKSSPETASGSPGKSSSGVL